ncbi:MAG TPA: hypothetical protein VN924_11475 [Bryobacteraceae bacterium]|nr:hypothetical protein [Bryobacteraceae bacterium]
MSFTPFGLPEGEAPEAGVVPEGGSPFGDHPPRWRCKLLRRGLWHGLRTERIGLPWRHVDRDDDSVFVRTRRETRTRVRCVPQRGCVLYGTASAGGAAGKGAFFAVAS